MLGDFISSRIKSIQFAIEGWRYVIKHEKNAWVHAAATILVIIFGFWLKISLNDWALILIMITLVWMAEFINTSIEAVVDLTSPAHHPLAKVGKDVGAAGVLIAACSSVLVGFLILGPPLLLKITSLLQP
jgi:diacylglycerol kinase (ATP)